MKTIKLYCDECKKEFERELKEYKRSSKLGRKFFCSGTCSSTNSARKRIASGEILSLPKEYIGRGGRKKFLSEFRPLFRSINRNKNTKKKRKNIPYEITLKDIEEMWNKQNGICVYTKMKMKLPEWNIQKEINTASVDRIDPDKGYTKDNCQIIGVMANFAKNDFSDEQMKEFCSQIVKNSIST